jgi:hypothetical protein
VAGAFRPRRARLAVGQRGLLPRKLRLSLLWSFAASCGSLITPSPQPGSPTGAAAHFMAAAVLFVTDNQKFGRWSHDEGDRLFIGPNVCDNGLMVRKRVF